MSLIGSENFLPGVLTEVESDYSFGYDSSQFGTTDSIVIVGTSFNGPVGTPIPVYSPEHARYVFGKAYDSKSKTEASLVAAIEDAYLRGARTIYGVRVSGKQVEKSFELALDTNLKLKVSSVVPSNQAKDYFMVYDNITGDEKIRIYKPAEKATIVEKMQGRVEADNSVIVTEIRLNRDYGMTKDSRLVDVINTVNGHSYNNVIKLSIVDVDGNEVTFVNEEALTIALGAMHPGAYMIGRDKSKCEAMTEMDYDLMLADADKPYESFSEPIYKHLKMNTDVAMELPVYAEDMDKLRNALRYAEVFMTDSYDFLEVAGIADKAFVKDSVDYEEVNISNFEIYKRLGSGFAIAARAERRVDANGKELLPRVKEAPISDPNRIVPMIDGIYSMLENMNARYRVMVAGNADSEISTKLPRPADFKVTAPVSANILKELIRVTPKVGKDEHSTPKSFEFKFVALEGDELSASIDEVLVDRVFKVVPLVDAAALASMNVENGELFLVKVDESTTILARYNKGAMDVLNGSSQDGTMVVANGKIFTGVNDGDNGVTFKVIDPSTAPFGGKKYLILENSGRTYAGEYVGLADVHVTPVGELESMLKDNDFQTVVYAQFNHGEANPIVVSSAAFDGITIEELVEYLNAHESLAPEFIFALTSKGAESKDEYVSDMAADAMGTKIVMAVDRESAYDYSKYVPYKTSDNFARQLAQHCTYTSLKTAPTHGLIGISKVSNMSLDGIAKKIDELTELELDLYAKTPTGRNMLDRNNMPYPIGKNISVPVIQYQTTLSDGYRFISGGAAGYAGTVSDLPLDQSSTNQPIDISSTMYQLTNYQLTKLTQKGFVTIKDSFTRGLVITDGITMASAESPFRRLSATRIIGAVEDLIRQSVEPFIGKQNHAANRNSMQTAIKSNLEAIKGRLIEDYEFSLVVDPAVMKFSYVDIDYKIVPVYEIREVRNRISVKEQL